MKNHTDLLNFLADKIKAQTYLEIGVSNRANNFDKINVKCKIGVDPNPKAQANYCCTSDEFFRINLDPDYDPLRMFNLVFIDGLHHADQAERDFRNSLKVLVEGGLIVLHDTNPEAEYLTHVPRDKKGRWLGDVYKFACRLNEYPNISFHTFDMDNGCTVVQKTNDCREREMLPEITWDYFNKNRKKLLKLVPAESFATLAL